MLLSAALIVRDEEDHLQRCLRSIVDIVDEIVVVDTGSTDASVAVAESFGARVLHRAWDGDFSAARNYGLDAVAGEWVLYIDADEHLRPISRAAVEAAMAERSECVAYRLLLQPRHSFTPYREYRMWPSRPDIRFRGVIHESITQDIDRIATTEGLRIEQVDLYLEHEGYEGDLTAKYRRNLPLLREQVVADPERVYLWGEIGRSHAGLGEIDEAVAAWTEGARRLRARGTGTAADSLVMVDLIVTHAMRGRPDAARVAEADEMFPGNVLIMWAGAMDAVERGAHAEVIERIDTLLAADLAEAGEQSLSLDHRLVGDWAHHARGMASFHLGDYAGAADDFAEAERLGPGIEEYRVKRRLAEAKARS